MDLPRLPRSPRLLFAAGVGIFLLLSSGCVEGETVVDRAAVSSSARHEEVGRSQGLPVSQVVERPHDYRDQEVVVYGKAMPGLAFEFVGEQPYLLELGGKSLWVVTRSTAPAQGEWLTVRGVLRMPYQLKGRHYQAALEEIERIGP